MFYCYILRCADGSLYCGSTTNLKKREQQHNAGKGSVYVRSRGGGAIIYHERFKTWGKTLRREYAIKKLSRSKKLALLRNKVKQ